MIYTTKMKKNKHFNEIYTVFGGTFYPIHNGHLFPLIILNKKFNIKTIYLLPNNNPIYKNNIIINDTHRFNMLKLTMNNNNFIFCNIIEINQIKYSFTFNTMYKLRFIYGKNTPIAFIIGYDSFINIKTWHNWINILNICHIIVLSRLNIINSSIPKIFKNKITENITDLKYYSQGLIFFLKNDKFNISSSQIRKDLHNIDSLLLPKYIKRYILINKLYNNE